MQYKSIEKRRILVTVLAGIVMLFASSNFSYARVTGATCSTCHTMHNSQNGSSMKLDSTFATGFVDPACYECHAETRAVLLRMDCLGCHAQNLGGSSNITEPGHMPQIALDINATSLAGGNYKYVIMNDSTYGHNVHGFGSGPIATGDLGNNPPGYNSNYDPSSGKYQPAQMADQIMCAGQNGCHGNRDQVAPYLAMKGTHHADDSMLKFGAGFKYNTQGDPANTGNAGNSYRFLYKIHGAEDNDWQATLGPADHNEYMGVDFAPRTGQTWNNITTISQFCAECHGDFHASGSSGIGSGASPWLRHPTDAILPNSGEYSAYTAYSTEAPIARPQSFFVTGLANADSVVRPGTDIVMCLSCHRAHASPYPDILRWDYSTMIAGGGGSGGCFTCHSKKSTNNP